MEIYDIFISYRRNGGFEVAAYLYNLLQNDGYSVSFDVDNLRSGRFDQLLLERIDSCKDFIVILDKNVFQRTLNGCDINSDWLRLELGHAIKKKKNILPIFLEGYVPSLEEDLPEDIAPIARYTGFSYNFEYHKAFYDRIKRTLICSPREQHCTTDDGNDDLIKEIKLSALSGDLDSQKSLGKYYWDKEDYSRSGEWLSKAAEQGDGMSKYLLACLMFKGKYPYHRKSDILALLLDAASLNIVESYLWIAAYYMDGYDGKKDYQKALTWLQRASSAGFHNAENMAICLQNLGKYEEALQLWKLEASKGNSTALYHCGVFYFNGLGCTQNFHEAKKWFEESASCGNIEALHGLANIYFDGLGVDKDMEKGIDLYKEAGDLGYTESHARLGSIYLDIYHDIHNAIKYFGLAAEKGHPVAQFNLGVIYYCGKVIEKDYYTAAGYFIKSAKQGYREAQKMLGMLYEQGHGVPQDIKMAKKWYTLAEGKQIDHVD